VGISPFGATVTSQSIQVTIFFDDDHGLNWGSMQISVNGVVDNTWSYTTNTGGTSGTSSKTLSFNCSPNQTCSLSVSASITDTDGLTSSTSSTWSYTAPPLPPARAAPTISLEPHPQDFRDLMCATCTNATLTYSTPAYTSLDVPRFVTLTYSSARAYPMGFVQADADLNVSTNPDGLSIQVIHNGSPLTLTNGAATSQYQWSGSIGKSRLAAQFDARSPGTNPYGYSVVGDAWWSTDHRTAPSVPTRILFIDEQNSPLGAGWSIAGLQRLVFVGDSVVLIDGAGTASFFASCGTNCWTSPRGDYSTLTRSGTNYLRTRRDGTVTTFNGLGYETQVTDRFGNTTLYGYDGSNRLTTITDPVGKVTTLAYSGDGSCTLASAAGKLCRITTPGNRTSQIRVNAAGDLDRIDDPDGVTAVAATYNNHLLAHWTDRRNAATDFGYDQFNQVQTVQSASVTTTDGVVRPTTTFTSLEAVSLPANASARTRVLPQSAAMIQTSPKGTITSSLAHRSGAALEVDVRDPYGRHAKTTYAYDDSSRLVQVTAPSGGTTVYTWQNSRLITMVDNGAGTSKTFKYIPQYDQVDSMWANGRFVQHNFFSASPNNYKAPDSVAMNDPGVTTNNVTRYTYDGHGRVLTARDPESHQQSLSYEAGGFQNRSSVAVNGYATSYSHDAYGRIYQVTDPNLRTITITYDALNRDTSIAGPLGKRVRKTYNDGAGIYEVVDAKSQKYTTYANPLGWITQKSYPIGNSEYYTFDKHGNVVRYTPRRGSSYDVVFTYDTLDRVHTRVADGLTTTFAYDTGSKWVAVSNAESTDTLFTDVDDRLSSAHSWRNGIRYEVNTGYGPDGSHGQTVGKAINGTTVIWLTSLNFGSDTLLRRNYFQDPWGRGTSIVYKKDDLFSTVTLPTGTTASQHLQVGYTYTGGHGIQQVSYNQGLDGSLGRSYGQDPLERNYVKDRGAYGDTYRRVVQFDDFGRLANYRDSHIWEEPIWTCSGLTEDDCYWDYQWHDDTIRSDTYSYDDAGNRTDRGAVIGNGNQITSFDGFTIVYDADNNVIQKSKSGVTNQTLTWNSLGQLTQVVVNGITTTYGYDGFGRRVRKTVNGVMTRYLWDGDNLAAEMNGDASLVRYYSYYPGIDRPHAVTRASDGKTFYYATELPGSVIGLVNSSNQLVNSYEYDPFGVAVATSEQVAQPFRFAGRELDSETGLYYMRARYYDPQLGRFLSEDPIGLHGGMNPFVFAANDPVDFLDPHGELFGWFEDLFDMFNETLGETVGRFLDGIINFFMSSDSGDGPPPVPLPADRAGLWDPDIASPVLEAETCTSYMCDPNSTKIYDEVSMGANNFQAGFTRAMNPFFSCGAEIGSWIGASANIDQLFIRPEGETWTLGAGEVFGGGIIMDGMKPVGVNIKATLQLPNPAAIAHNAFNYDYLPHGLGVSRGLCPGG
jgi:RHS repeat-associated protein